MFIDMNTFNLLTPNSIYLDSSISSSSNTPSICNRLVNFINNLFKTRILYKPLTESSDSHGEDNFNSNLDRGLNPYTTLSPLSEDSSSLESARQLALKRRRDDDQ
jgi:hypothetical protein